MQNRTIFVGKTPLDLNFSNDEDLIKMANFMNFSLFDLEKKISAHLLTINKDKPFSRSRFNGSNI